MSALSDADPKLKPLFAAVGDLNFRHRAGGFEGLLRLIVEQQLSVKAADSIWQKVRLGLGDILPANLLAQTDDALRGHGLSRPKAKYARILAEAVHDRSVDFDRLPALDPEAAITHLTALKGIGRWTAEVYLMFCEGRLDVFPTGDIALREAVGWLDGLDARPDEAYCRARAEVWAPYRSVAAHALWGWYGAVKRGELSRTF
ncbi:DNA-3-methyladenine glycosylase 2 family protein [Asticcacaulis sp. BYS171W]|uniref:DNA-3-methyladenine glycosylase II n=1 Tax=Asticcacaulis aquaticus TaxID=2984212 RepID=A0ABT5HTR6_9CAUL|nr:DNA-3-methyladenine glycosylase 2 family protein [Asticcacaulis aquaticus]MDC7683333.1 DNA-3-methyladenine glycosylase 2 family protein [Asticcacaulis aquaticus]